MIKEYRISWLSARTYLFEGKVDGAWSPEAGFFLIATYKSQKIEEVNIFVKAEIEVLHFKFITRDVVKSPYL